MKSIYKMAVLALCLALPVIASAATKYDFEDGGIFYKVISLEDMTAGVASGDKTYTGKIEIPESVTYNGKTFAVSEICNDAFRDSEIRGIHLPQNLSSIGSTAFFNAKNLTEISLPTNRPLTIGARAFENTSIECIKVPNNVTEIGLGCFFGCKSLIEATIGEGLIEIPNSAFQHCSNLETVTLGSNIRKIDHYAFENCSHLVNITLPPELKEFGNQVFGDCKELTTIVLPESLSNISHSLFQKCERLKEIVIPDRIRTISAYAFDGCTRLTTITLGSNVESIEGNWIRGCTALKEISIGNPEPPKCPEFENKHYMDITLKVPREAITDYKNAEPWKNFWNIESIGSSSVSDIVSDTVIYVREGSICMDEATAEKGINIFDLSGRIVYAGHRNVISDLPKGLYIVKTSKGAVKVIL